MKRSIRLAVMTLLFGVLALFPAVHAKAAGKVDVPLKVTFHQTEARREFDMVNSFRTGDEAWYWNEDDTTRTTPSLGQLRYDYNLEKVAMQRAVEIALYYGHTRADQSSCWQTYSDCGYSYSEAGENMAAGYDSAEEVFEDWKEDYDDYSGQGHRRNMLNERFVDCGFACVEFNGRYFWVQEFARGRNPSYTETSADNSTCIRTAAVNQDNISCFSIEDLSLQNGQVLNLADVTVNMSFDVKGRNYNRKVVVAPDWSVEDTAIASVSNGSLMANNSGTTRLNGSFLLGGANYSVSSIVEVTGAATGHDTSEMPVIVSGVNLEDTTDPVVGFVSRMYTVALGRDYDEGGLNDWSGQLKNGTNDGAGIARGFIESTEFINRNLSNEEYLDVLYHTFFERDPDAEGYNGWLARLYNGASRRHVLAGFVNSDEFTVLCNRFGIIRGTLEDDGNSGADQNATEQVRAFVERMYAKALRRSGDEAGIQDWTWRIVSGDWKAADVAKTGFFNSQEYLNKNRSDEDFVEDLYQALFDRASDAEGKAYWLSRLSEGASREDIMNGFGGSQEFANMLAGFGLSAQ